MLLVLFKLQTSESLLCVSHCILWQHIRAVPISLLADYTDTEYTRLFKQQIPKMQPIIKGRLLPIFLAKIS